MRIFGIKIKKRIIAIVAMPFILFLSYETLIDKENVTKNLSQSITPKAEFVINGFKLFESQGDGRDWNVKASVAEVQRSKDIANLKEVKLTFYNIDGRIFKLSSSKAILNMKTKEILLNENVTAISDDGYSLTTDEATFYPDKQILKGKSKIKLEGPDIIMTGVGFIGNLQKKTTSVFNNTITTIKNQNSGLLIKQNKKSKPFTLTITSKKCSFDMNKKKANYSNNVTAKGSGFVITANKMTIDYQIKEQDGSINQVLALGNVKINKDGRHSSSEKALLETKTNTLILTGEPSLYDQNNVLKGEKIVYNYVTDKFQIMSPTGIYKAN